jgi:hypothetical protein
LPGRVWLNIQIQAFARLDGDQVSWGSSIGRAYAGDLAGLAEFFLVFDYADVFIDA